MYDQPKFLPDQQNSIFPNEQSNRMPRRTRWRAARSTTARPSIPGETGDALATTFPVPVTPTLMARGREVFDINCSPCHGRDGYGDGIVVQRGFPPPPSFHTDRLRQAPVGHFFEVITHGYGAMYPFGSRISPQDRWAIDRLHPRAAVQPGRARGAVDRRGPRRTGEEPNERAAAFPARGPEVRPCRRGAAGAVRHLSASSIRAISSRVT